MSLSIDRERADTSINLLFLELFKALPLVLLPLFSLEDSDSFVIERKSEPVLVPAGYSKRADRPNERHVLDLKLWTWKSSSVKEYLFVNPLSRGSCAS